MSARPIPEPPSVVVWAIEGELRGHMVAETIKWLSDTADWAAFGAIVHHLAA